MSPLEPKMALGTRRTASNKIKRAKIAGIQDPLTRTGEEELKQREAPPRSGSSSYPVAAGDPVLLLFLRGFHGGENAKTLQPRAQTKLGEAVSRSCCDPHLIHTYAKQLRHVAAHRFDFFLKVGALALNGKGHMGDLLLSKSFKRFF